MASQLGLSKEMSLFSGVIIASSLGATISFTIPIALGMINKKDIKYFSKGVMIGIITIPIGCFFGGVWKGLDFSLLLWNLSPILVFAIIISIGLLLVPSILMKGFDFFGKAIVALSVAGLLLQGIDSILGIKIVQGLAPLSESTVIVSKIAFVLGGAYPILAVINKICKKSFESIGDKFGINSASVSGLIGNLANNLLVFGTYNEMNPKGKVMCTSFAVSGAFVFGGQFGFVSGVAPNMIGSFIISKLSAGIISIILAEKMYNWEEKKKGWRICQLKRELKI